MTAPPVPANGGYSFGLVATLIKFWRELDAPDGKIPRRQWLLATRSNQRTRGGAVFEAPACYRADVLTALAQLSPADRDLIQARMAGAVLRGIGRRFGMSPDTARLRIDAAIQTLADILNGGDASMPRANEGKARPANGRSNGQHDPDLSLPDQLPPGEAEVMSLYDHLDRKLAKLPPNWEQINIRKGMNGSCVIRVTY